MSGNKAVRRAFAEAANDAHRMSGLPKIVNATEFVTPDSAREFLKHNSNNRPINWAKVEEYAEEMRRGRWELHGQGFVLDDRGNLLTGQKRLWAIIMSGLDGVYMQVSRGNPPSTSRLIDRGEPQSARDLASRETGRKHSPTEVSVARAIAAFLGNIRPSKDELATIVSVHSGETAVALRSASGTKKSKAVLMILGAIVAVSDSVDDVESRVAHLDVLAERLAARLDPHSAESYWNRGASFGLAMSIAAEVVRGA